MSSHPGSGLSEISNEQPLSSAIEGQAEMPDSAALVSPSTPRRLSFLSTLLVALLGAAVALPAVISLDGAFPVENLSVEMTNRIRNRSDDPIAWAKERSNRWTSLYQTTAACLAVFGASVGTFAGFALSFRTQPLLTTLRSAVLGGLIGGLSAAAGAMLEAAFLIKIETLTLDVTLKTIIGHAVAWSVLAAGLSLLFIPIHRDLRGYLTMLSRGIVAGSVAALVYSPLAAIVFQLERSDMSIPEGSLNKLMFLSLSALLILYGIQIPAPSLKASVQADQASLPGTSFESSPTH